MAFLTAVALVALNLALVLASRAHEAARDYFFADPASWCEQAAAHGFAAPIALPSDSAAARRER